MSQNFPGGMPPDPSHTIYITDPAFLFALGSPDPLGGPGCKLASKRPASIKLHTGCLLQLIQIWIPLPVAISGVSTIWDPQRYGAPQAPYN